ncbi:MAG: GNAT family N-acetyltransferase [Candidatus Hodarchaeota archaeon]
MNAWDLIKIQLELECKGVNAQGDIIPVPCPNPDDIARLMVLKYDDDYAVFFRYDFPSVFRSSLAALLPKTLFTEHERVQAILSHHKPCLKVWIGKSFIFPDQLRERSFPDVVKLAEENSFAMIVDGEIASSCSSSRENDSAAEAWVFTEPNHRKRGFGKQVTAAWAQFFLEQGKIPFYSYHVGNSASEGIARSLGLIEFVHFVAYP